MVNLKQKDNEDAKTYSDRAILLQEKMEVVSEDLLNLSTEREISQIIPEIEISLVMLERETSIIILEIETSNIKKNQTAILVSL